MSDTMRDRAVRYLSAAYNTQDLALDLITFAESEVAREREACAVVCDQLTEQNTDECVRRIRARDADAK